MQPSTDTGPRKPSGDVDTLYRRHRRELHRAVSRAVHAPSELVEDACQTVWAILLRRQPELDTAFAWLRMVAIREATLGDRAAGRAARAAALTGRQLAGNRG
jgi:DNA-directed RNA polymerase specialized sigma24 family protein